MIQRGSAVEYRRLRAPRTDRTVWADPPLSAAGEVVAENVARRASYDYDLQGRSLAELSRMARSELLRAAMQYTSSYRDVRVNFGAKRVFLAGHQPQLFHPGVWIKNFALGRLAELHDAVAINLVIDSDSIRTPSIRVPGGTVATPTVEAVPFDGPGPDLPFEERSIVDHSLWKSFGDRAAKQIAPLAPDALVRDFWPLAIARARDTNNLGVCLSQARHLWEQRWGSSTLELPQGHVCSLPASCWFIAHLLAHLPRLWEIYNTSLAEYRKLHHIRSANHPAPALAAIDDWLEAPFWIWQTSAPARKRLFVRGEGDELILSDRQQFELRLPLTPEGEIDRAAEILSDLASQGVKLRTRALLTTLLARVLFGDLFLHGIGGAKYDQLTDVIIRRFFGIDPPEYLIVSATLQLPIPREPASMEELRRLDHLLRELEFHPERHLRGDEPSADGPTRPAELAADKRRWIEDPPPLATPRERCHRIRAINEALQPWMAAPKRELLADRQELARRLRSEEVLASREYAFCLYPAGVLQDFLLAFLPSAP
ncbi:MAG: hypothetical protein HY000_05980 [Planctomycetes bacterium]|nr:hypothetical protein [Planctomycetota bacterium]